MFIAFSYYLSYETIRARPSKTLQISANYAETRLQFGGEPARAREHAKSWGSVNFCG